MRARLIIAILAIVIAATLPECARRSAPAREERVDAGGASLYAREIGRGTPIIVLHGGPDFDSGYLLPDFDRLADSYRLIYYDQRGRGQSATGVRPEDVGLASDVEDVDRVRQHFKLDTPTLVGHSWGAVLALEYALRYPDRLSRLILMNPAPASASDVAVLRKFQQAALGPEMDRQRAIQASDSYKAGDPETVAARYRIHFKRALARENDYERLMATMKAGFVRQGSEGILKAWAVEDRLMVDSWLAPGYDLLPKLTALKMPTLVIYGDHDFIPSEIVKHIVAAMPQARYVTLPDCGHFTYMECPAGVRKALDDFFRDAPR